MSRLARDVRGNALMLMGASLIPLAGMVGGGIDIARMYILKTRLQHACDAGALAGRRAMGGGTWSFNNNYANSQAEQFFTGNFESGSFGSYATAKEFTEQAGKVSGRVSATIPMTLTRIIGFKTDQLIEVTCASEMRLPNTDVMFVLDTTGSMNDVPPGDTVKKIDALKTSVKCFYEIVARLDTDATCATGTPSGGVGDQVQVRFGFVPYATNVNVGRLLKPEWFADSWNYQTRRASGTDWTSWTLYNYYTTSRTARCNAAPGSSSNEQFRVLGPQNTYNGTTYGSYFCIYERRALQVRWEYNKLPVNVGLLKNGTSWNASFDWPIDVNGTSTKNKRITWEGCLEERNTVSQSSYTPIPAGAKDLNIDALPSDASTRWGMVLPDVTYTRGWSMNAVFSADDLGNESYYACPQESRKLQEWNSASAFDDYVDSLTPEGNTYHDIGLIWGARLASPTGLFAAENALTPGGGEIERHMIFMTDGDACTAGNNYTAYGVNWLDRRTIGSGTDPGFDQNCTGGAALTDQVNARTEALCAAIRNKNITLWVIAFGNLATSTETRLSNCATPGRYFKATNGPQLQATFKSIADQISMLRLTQ
ncbi:TadE/TadG family type IV pilus assembly protein [Sphingomonas sp. RS2018]